MNWNKRVNEQKRNALKWLSEKVFPLWSAEGIDSQSGAFVESISFAGKAENSSRRALVQARQIYSFVEAWRLDVIKKDRLKPIIQRAIHAWIKLYRQPSGAFIHSVNTAGKPMNTDLDLYTQAFVLFGLAQAYEVFQSDESQAHEIKSQALKVLNYLKTERKNPAGGGYTEIKNGELLYQSNPHMHLFEAALAWTRLESDPQWRSLSDELYQLCCQKFIDSSTGFLAEHFDQNSQPLREGNRFIFEPGHHYEWAWLFVQYEKITGQSVGDRPQNLFELAEKFGLTPDKTLAYDEILSDGKVKKNTSRFWPQCERIKAAVALKNFEVADEAMKALFNHFIISDQGLWKDNLTNTEGPAKGSSLYHIINAISEYVQFRK